MYRLYYFSIFLFVTIGVSSQNDTIKKSASKLENIPEIKRINARIIEEELPQAIVDEPQENNEDVIIVNDVEIPTQLPKEEAQIPNESKSKYSVREDDEKHDFMLGPKPFDNDVLVVKRFDGKDVSETKLITGQDLGTIESNTKSIRIEYKDFGMVDGDRVRIYLNEDIIESNVHLDGLFYTKYIKLSTKGFNRIDIQAINQGFVGPNTAEFIVYDDKGKVIAHKSWNLQTGNIATLGIVKF
ncbi:MAG: hypothetical protein V3U80_01940 [Flavobacteriaceae bacterium]